MLGLTVEGGTCVCDNRNASISMNAETMGEHTVKYEDNRLRDEIVQMLKGSHSNVV